jgi:hypothetical protein
MTTQMLCSEEAWEIIMIFTLALAKALKTLEANPGIPIMPPPSMLRRAAPGDAGHAGDFPFVGLDFSGD